MKLLLLIALFLSCAALVGFAERIIGRQAQSIVATEFDMALHIPTVLLVSVVIYLCYAVIHPERF